MSNTDFALAVEDLSVAFDGFKAIDSLNLYVDRNELRVIIGPNGAGKTTLLDLICGKTRASGGSIKFKNIELTAMAEHKRVRLGIGRKFQTPSIYENLSVFRNLEVSYPEGRSVFGALAFRCTEAVQNRVREVAADIGLGDRLESEAGLLSHGQKQWLEIGMLLMQEPQLLLLDEPSLGLAPIVVKQIFSTLRELAKTGMTIFLVEQNANHALKLSDRAYVMVNGQIRMTGTGQELLVNEEVRNAYLGGH